MPFGLATTPSTLQRANNVVLSQALGKHALAYLDDVVVYSKSSEDHHLTINSFKFLDLVIPQGTSPDPGKIEAIS